MTAGMTTAGGGVEVMKNDVDDPEAENMEDADELDVVHDLSEGLDILNNFADELCQRKELQKPI